MSLHPSVMHTSRGSGGLACGLPSILQETGLSLPCHHCSAHDFACTGQVLVLDIMSACTFSSLQAGMHLPHGKRCLTGQATTCITKSARPASHIRTEGACQLLACSRLVMEPNKMPKKSTPMSWANSMMARSASLLGRMSPKPMVETVVKDQ